MENVSDKKENKTDFYNFVETKSEKLVTAMYMITNFLSDKEPIKWKLRDLGLSMLSDSSALKEKNPSEQWTLLSRIHTSIGEILALVEICHLAGFISEMNYTILKREYHDLMSHIASQEDMTNSLNKIALQDSFFASSSIKTLQSGKEEKTEEVKKEIPLQPVQRIRTESPTDLLRTKVVLSERPFESSKKVFETKDKLIEMIKDKNGRPTQFEYLSLVPEEVKTKKEGKVDVAKNKRREEIVQVLKSKGEVTIKDISQQVSKCGEKTIQRELVEMLQKGQIKRTGDRRWSRYSLV
jgi:hypothetical protein